MNQSLKIYLGDLTYDTICVSTNGTPLNIGYIASHCIQLFKSDIEIVLYKYISDLDRTTTSEFFIKDRIFWEAGAPAAA